MEGETRMPSRREPGCTFAGKVRSKAALLPGGQRSAARLTQLHAGNVDRKFQLQRVALFIGERLAGDDGIAHLLRAHAPIQADLGARQHADIARGALQHVQALEIERDAHRLFGGQVVVDQGGNHDLIALHEKARHGQAQDQVLAHDGLDGGAAHLGIGRDAARGGAPGGQRIGELHLGLRLARRHR